MAIVSPIVLWLKDSIESINGNFRHARADTINMWRRSCCPLLWVTLTLKRWKEHILKDTTRPSYTSALSSAVIQHYSNMMDEQSSGGCWNQRDISIESNSQEKVTKINFVTVKKRNLRPFKTNMLHVRQTTFEWYSSLFLGQCPFFVRAKKHLYIHKSFRKLMTAISKYWSRNSYLLCLTISN